MANKDIVELGRATRFSKSNQPTKRGRIKGKPNKGTIIKAILSLSDDDFKVFERSSKVWR